MVDRSFLTSAGVTEGSIERGVPLKEASDGGGGMMGDPSLALMDCLRYEILIEKKLEKLSQSFRFSSSEVICRYINIYINIYIYLPLMNIIH